MFSCASCTSSGCSTRQDTHHDAHTLSNHTLPLRSAGPSVSPGACSLDSRNAGAGLPISGEGTSRGSRLKPTQRKVTRTTKMPKGMVQRNAFIIASIGRRRDCRSGKRRGTPAPYHESVTTVGDRDQPAASHQQCAPPDPVDERLQIDAHGPGAAWVVVGKRLAQRHIAVAEHADVDSRNRHRLPRRVVDALFRMQGFEQTSVPAYLDRTGHGAIVRTGPGMHAEETELVAADGHILSRLERDVLLDFVALDQRNADDEHGDA